MKQEILHTLGYLANALAETVVYKDSWDAKFCKEEMERAYHKANEALKEYLDWDNLTEQDCKDLRFMKWSDETNIRLIPIWLYGAIPVGIKLTSIGGEEIVFDGKNIDTDTRFGCLAYGIIPKPDNDKE